MKHFYTATFIDTKFGDKCSTFRSYIAKDEEKAMEIAKQIEADSEGRLALKEVRCK